MGIRSLALCLAGLIGVSTAAAQRIPVLCLHDGEAAAQAPVYKAVTLTRGGPPVHEVEPASATGFNDVQADAQYLGTLGLPGLTELQVHGHLSGPPIRELGTFTELTTDDGAIQLARNTSIDAGGRIRLHAQIGDGPHGSMGGATGDYDFYRLGPLETGQIVSLDLDTVGLDSALQPKAAFYDQTGQLLNLDHRAVRGQQGRFIELTVPAAGTYFAIVRGINSSWPIDPFDPSSGPKVGSEGAYALTIGVDAVDFDWYSVELRAGDVISVALEYDAFRQSLYNSNSVMLLGTAIDRSALLPVRSPLLRGGNANLAHVVARDGVYALEVRLGYGDYALSLAVHRPPPQPESALPVLFVDFDGAVYDAFPLGGHENAELAPLSHFLELIGAAHLEDAIIDITLEVLAENLIGDLQAGPNPGYSLVLLNSRDHADPWGAENVSRVIVGGSQQQIGMATIGVAESVDVGNFVLNETAIVLLDKLLDLDNPRSYVSVTRAPGVGLEQLIGQAFGNIVAHEFGHLTASHHTGHEAFPVQIMDARPDASQFVGAGPDQILGTDDDKDVDLGITPYFDEEGYAGLHDSRAAIAFGLRGPQALSVVHLPEKPHVLGPVYPNPAVGTSFVDVMLERVTPIRLDLFDILGRHARTLYDGVGMPGQLTVSIPTAGLAAGHYLIRATAGESSITQPVILMR